MQTNYLILIKENGAQADHSRICHRRSSGEEGISPQDPLRIDAPFKPSSGRRRFPFESFLWAQLHYIEYLQNLQIFQRDIPVHTKQIAETRKLLKFLKMNSF